MMGAFVSAAPSPMSATPVIPAIDAPRDRPFRGMVALDVDATDVDHQVFGIVETMPVQAAGPLTLLYPRWETGSHAPTATVAELAGLRILAEGRPLAWRRDPVDTHAFHVEVPPGARTVTVRMQFLAPQSAALLRPEMVVLPWHRLLLYPAGWTARNISVATRVTLPPGLTPATALEVAAVGDDSVRFAPVTLDALVDAPVYAARAHRSVDLGAAGGAPVTMELLADDAAHLALPPVELERLRALPVQAERLFGAPPFRRYRALVTLSDVLPSGGGIEHLEEGENNLPANYFTDGAHQLPNRDLIVHEYAHAWNGVYRQPADLYAPDFNQPVRASLLWVYEGQTEFWGRVLAARTGMRTVQETLDRLALDASLVQNRKGRSWKPLADSLNDALYMAGHPVAWRDWQRREDYYPEGVLLWLDVEARLRGLTDGRVGLDDFARRFFAVLRPRQPGPGMPSLYTFEDVCATLDGLAHADWRAILTTHLESNDEGVAMEGLARAGWRLRYDAVPSESFLQDEADAGVRNLDASIGLQVRPNGAVRSVGWGGPAFNAGLAPGARILAVNGAPFDADALVRAVGASASAPLSLDIESGGRRRTVRVDYRGALRYPHLERIPETPDYLTPLLAPR
jgi:predicted metalloprotease with PDZ domain